MEKSKKISKQTANPLWLQLLEGGVFLTLFVSHPPAIRLCNVLYVNHYAKVK